MRESNSSALIRLMKLSYFSRKDLPSSLSTITTAAEGGGNRTSLLRFTTTTRKVSSCSTMLSGKMVIFTHRVRLLCENVSITGSVIPT